MRSPRDRIWEAESATAAVPDVADCRVRADGGAGAEVAERTPQTRSPPVASSVDLGAMP
jgi:hypothetical protein